MTNTPRPHHKNYIGKEMYIVVTAYVLMENDITGSGKDTPITCMGVGVMKNRELLLQPVLYRKQILVSKNDIIFTTKKGGDAL